MQVRAFEPAPEADSLLPELWTAARAFIEARKRLGASLACRPRALKPQIAKAYPLATPGEIQEAAQAASEAVKAVLGVPDIATCAREVRTTQKPLETLVEKYLDALGTDLERLPIKGRLGLEAYGYRESASPRRRARALVLWVAYSKGDPVPTKWVDEDSDEDQN